MTDHTDQLEQSVLNDAFSFEQHMEYLNSDEFRQQQLKRFAENYRKQKSLELENKAILSGFADPEKRLQLVSDVSKVWGKVLETNTETHTIEDIVKLSLEQDRVIFLNENKHTNYFPSEAVFNTHLDNPLQKALVRSKYLGKRQTKKQKTPLQTINYVYGAKSASDRDDKINQIEESLKQAHNMIGALAINQLEIQSQLNKVGSTVNEVNDKLVLVEKEYKDRRKVLAYILLTTQQHLTTAEVAEQVGVSKKTITRWESDYKIKNLL